MTSALSKLFRISISKGREIISLKDELAHVEYYLTIQKMRYKDKFSSTIDIDPDLLEENILKITLQPLVENAIYHGIKEVDYKGHITIKGRTLGDCIQIEITDNGRGMDKKALDELKTGIETPFEERALESRQGMGVRSVHERIQIYFGEEYGLSVTSHEGEGTCMSILIPRGVKEMHS